MMADKLLIESFYTSHQALYDHLVATLQVSFAADMNVTFSRSLVLAIASYFEEEVTEIMKEVPVRHAGGNVMIVSMIERHIISRKYHTYFDWEDLKATKFFGLFGDNFKARIVSKIHADQTVKAAEQAFLQLGQLRNKLVHQNYVQYDVPKTPTELMDQFRIALLFIEFLRSNLFPAAWDAMADII